MEADYIVVGAGSAGCVLANRLSEDGRTRVLLIEAGGSDRNLLFRVPLLAGVAYWYKPSNWGYVTAPQRHLGGREIKWPRGKVLGGSSTINGMMYMRGNAADYDGWAQAGCTGWSYADVLPYFRRSEDNPERPGDPFHGQGGPLHVEKAKGENRLYAAFLKAAGAEGHPRNDDFNGAGQEGLGFYDFNIRKGRRVSSATAFLAPATNRPNLEVWSKTMARRIVIEEGRATGLEVGEFVHTFGDAHLYANHFEQARLQLTRDPRPLPRLVMNPDKTDLFGWDYEDFTLVDFEINTVKYYLLLITSHHFHDFDGNSLFFCRLINHCFIKIL